MSNPYLQESAIFLINAVFGLYCVFVMLRFLLQLIRADFYNPLSQFVVKVTQPFIFPLRRIIPGLWGMDMASLVLLLGLKAVQIWLIFLAAGQAFSMQNIIVLAFVDVFALILDIYMVTILIEVIISWFGPGRSNDVLALIYQLNRPILKRVRRVIPSYAGMDFSPLVVLIIIQLLKILIIGPITQLGVL